MNLLRVRCRSAEEFRSIYHAIEPAGGIFCQTTQQLAKHAPVVVELACKDLPNRVLIKGTVVSWRPALPWLRVRAGACVRFLPEEAAKRDFVVETLLGAGRKSLQKRKHARIPIAHPVQIRLLEASQPLSGVLREISVSGALFACPLRPRIGSDVVLQLVPPGAVAPLDISASVLYHAPPDLIGVRFQFREGGGSRRLRELVRRFKTS